MRIHKGMFCSGYSKNLCNKAVEVADKGGGYPVENKEVGALEKTKRKKSRNNNNKNVHEVQIAPICETGCTLKAQTYSSTFLETLLLNIATTTTLHVSIIDSGSEFFFNFLSIQAVDMELDATPFLGNIRSKRYSMVIEDGVVKQLQMEPDGTGLSCSLANDILSLL